MDGPVPEHSDSDSGDSWTLLDNSTSFDDEPRPTKRELEYRVAGNHEKDEDTDGISIISDSDLESPTFFDLGINNSEFVPPEAELDHPNEPSTPQYIPIDPQSTTNLQNVHDEPMTIEEHFQDNRNHKIYVHRRNKRISTVLNIIMLGSIITAAGVAIGHMWGVKNDCSTHTMPSVNKILSNLYKLQEENAYLRNKLKELTSLSHIEYIQKNPSKQNKCKKVFEESLQNHKNNVKYVTKCVDHTANNKFSIDKQFEEPKVEKDFIADVDKFKAVYIQNKSLLDEEIVRRYKRENKAIKNLKTQHISQLNKIKEEKKSDESIVTNNETNNSTPLVTHKIDSNEHTNKNNQEELKRKISYADSLKSNIDSKSDKRTTKNITENKLRHSNKKPKVESDNDINKTLSEEDFKKDNRYKDHKHKHEKQKHDRQKSYKKQKRRNKYEQWEMKGGLLRDYDEFSLLSSNDNDLLYNAFDIDLNQDNKETKPIDNMNVKKANKVLDRNYHKPSEPNSFSKQGNLNKTGKKSNWYEERVILRNEARKKLEHELFGETKPNTANWYFRRMHKREQCRAKPDNTTYRKFSKHNMNFKTKH